MKENMDNRLIKSQRGLVKINGETMYVVERIVGVRDHGINKEFLVKWKHWHSSYNNWEPLTSFPGGSSHPAIYLFKRKPSEKQKIYAARRTQRDFRAIRRGRAKEFVPVIDAFEREEPVASPDNYNDGLAAVPLDEGQAAVMEALDVGEGQDVVQELFGVDEGQVPVQELMDFDEAAVQENPEVDEAAVQELPEVDEAAVHVQLDVGEGQDVVQELFGVDEGQVPVQELMDFDEAAVQENPKVDEAAVQELPEIDEAAVHVQLEVDEAAQQGPDEAQPGVIAHPPPPAENPWRFMNLINPFISNSVGNMCRLV